MISISSTMKSALSLSLAVMLLVNFGTAYAGPVADLIARAKAAGSQRTANEISPLALEFGLRELAPPDASIGIREAVVNEALEILTHGGETDDVLIGLMRGLAIIRESTNPLIVPTICGYTSDSKTLELRLEAAESLRIRCLKGSGDPSACSCPLEAVE